MLSRLIPILIFCFCTCSLAGQDNVRFSPEKRKLHWGINSSIDYTYRTVVNRTDDPMFDEFIDLYNDIEVGSLGFSIGGSIQIPFSSRMNLNTGVGFSRQGHQTRLRDNFQWPVQVEDGEFDPTQPPGPNFAIQFLYRYYYLDIPVTMQYFTGSSGKWFISLGFSLDLLLNATTTQVVKDNGKTTCKTVQRNGDFADLNFMPQIGFGKSFNIGQKSKLNVSPVFRYGIIPILANKTAEYNWSTGLTMNVLFGV